MKRIQNGESWFALGLPRQVDFMEWECKIHIDGLELIVRQAFGVDSMQALLLGVEALRLSLKRSPYRLAGSAIPPFIPMVAFRSRWEEILVKSSKSEWSN
jgi:hypothetical protein